MAILNFSATDASEKSKPLPPCPPAGTGVHRWIMQAAWRCRANGMTPTEAIAAIESMITRRPNPANEIEVAVGKVYGTTTFTPSTPRQTATKKWPDVNQEQREAIIANGIGLVDLWEVSPIRFDDGEQHTEAIIDRLFPGNPLLCVGLSNSDFATGAREDFRGAMHDFPLIVPNPMTARTGRTQAGHLSAHSLENTGPRRFLVIELDSGTADEQAAIIAHLAQFAPLVLVLSSGGKSLHAWFYCQGQPEDRLHRFMRRAVALGADTATWNRTQFVRMPDATRDNGRRQTVFFFNPAVIAS